MILEPTGMDKLIDPSVKPEQCACGSDEPKVTHSLLSCRFMVSYSEVYLRVRKEYIDYVLNKDPRTEELVYG